MGVEDRLYPSRWSGRATPSCRFRAGDFDADLVRARGLKLLRSISAVHGNLQTSGTANESHRPSPGDVGIAAAHSREAHSGAGDDQSTPVTGRKIGLADRRDQIAKGINRFDSADDGGAGPEQS